LNAEAVNWISARGDPMAATFVLASISCFAAWWAHRGAILLSMSVGLFALALSSKESSLALPFLLGAFLIAFTGVLRRKSSFRRALVASVPFVAVMVLYGIVRSISLGSLLVSYPGWSPDYRLDWTFKAFSRLVIPLNASGVALPTTLAGPGLSALRRDYLLAFAAGGVAASLLPVVQFFQSMDDLQGSRMWYMPNAFFCAGLGHWFARVLACARPRRVEILSVHVVLLLGLFMFILSRNNEPWAAAGKLSGELVEDWTWRSNLPSRRTCTSCTAGRRRCRPTTHRSPCAA
jgi:hypothetical protein